MICTHHKYNSSDQIEKNNMGGARSMGGERRGVFTVVVRKPEGRTPPGRPRRRWEDNLSWIFRKWNGGHELD